MLLCTLPLQRQKTLDEFLIIMKFNLQSDKLILYKIQMKNSKLSSLIILNDDSKYYSGLSKWLIGLIYDKL